MGWRGVPLQVLDLTSKNARTDLNQNPIEARRPRAAGVGSGCSFRIQAGRISRFSLRDLGSELVKSRLNDIGLDTLSGLLSQQSTLVFHHLFAPFRRSCEAANTQTMRTKQAKHTPCGLG